MTPHAGSSRPGSRLRELLIIGSVALLLRVLLCVIVLLSRHISFDRYARLYDGNSYLITASAMLGDRSEFNDYHGRVFPGYPAMIALVHAIGIPLPAAAVAIDWTAAVATAVLAAMLFADHRVGWAMATLIPHYLMNSSLALSEAPLLAFTLGGLMLAQRGRARGAAGGAMLGYAGLIRPMACFAAVGYVFMQLKRRNGVQILIAGGSALIVLAAGALLVQHWRGDALAEARYYANSPNTYNGHLLTWPFRSLLLVPHERHVPPWRVAYMWIHALVALAACAAIAMRFRPGVRSLDWRDALAGPWLWCNTAFALCIGSLWGFECFHRFTIPALPAMFWAIRAALPRKAHWWVLIGAASLLIAVLSVLHDLPV